MAGFSGDNNDTISINITPMMDVFSILITFLLMSYSTDPVNHDISDETELPSSLTLSGLDEIPTIMVSKKEIYVNDKRVSVIGPDGDVPEADRDQGAIRPIYDELLKLKETTDRIRKEAGQPEKLGSVTMEMDKNHQFKLMKRIMLAAQQAEYVTFKLMVKKQ